MEGRWLVSVATAGVCSNSLWNVAGLLGGAGRAVVAGHGGGEVGRSGHWHRYLGSQGVRRGSGAMAIGDCRLGQILFVCKNIKKY